MHVIFRVSSSLLSHLACLYLVVGLCNLVVEAGPADDPMDESTKPEGRRPAECIIADVAGRYTRLSAYRDETIVSTIPSVTTRRSSRAYFRFSVDFDKSDHISLEWRQIAQPGKKAALLPSFTFSASLGSPGQDAEETTLFLCKLLDLCCKMPDNATNHVVKLLSGCKPCSEHLLASLRNLERLSDEDWEDLPCYVITGTGATGKMWTLWIDTEHLLIRKIESRTPSSLNDAREGNQASTSKSDASRITTEIHRNITVRYEEEIGLTTGDGPAPDAADEP